MAYKSYCDYANSLKDGEANHHKIYHDLQYGSPIRDDNELFGRLLLEINQAGLSWDTVLKKQKNFRKAYSRFSIKKIASYTHREKERLLADAGIVRNRLKIDAAIFNANVILRLQEEHGSFQKWLEKQGVLSREEWTTLFKKTFRFTGSEIVNEFLVSAGYLPGAHEKKCRLYAKVLRSGPAWRRR